jgi:hypothetical protein
MNGTLGKEILIFRRFFLGLVLTKESLLQANIGTFDALFEDEDEEKMKMYLTTKVRMKNWRRARCVR